MPQKDLTLTIERREHAGSTHSRALRHSGKIPAVLYGHGTSPQHIAFDARTFDELLHDGGRSSLITLMLNGRKADTALVRELQRDPLTRKIIHADLQRVSVDEEVHTTVPVVTVGVPVGVREYGGVLDMITRELEISGPVNRLPSQVEIDVSQLSIHDHITASEVALPEGFKLLTPGDQTVAAVEASRTAAQLEEAEAAAAAGEAPQPEVIGEEAPSETTPAQTESSG
ncbi:MAG: 50S ribosomal protein L25 [Candidatus Eremiobacteraeota bacterium]|nr:50S ribosomal protein L25 [Candidatus Eremiobacteraeota bacterium]